MNLAIRIEKARILKCDNILDMLNKLNPMVDDVCEKLNIYDSLPYDAPLKLFTTKYELKDKLNTYKAMQERLWNYYAKTLEK